MPGGTCGLFPSVEEHRKNHPVTNADRIRASSDEELAEFLEKSCDCVDCPAEKEMCFNYDKSCGEAWLDWLRSPAEATE